MDVAEILQGKCACADAKGVVMGHFYALGQLTPSPGLEATAVLRLHGWQTGFGSWQQLSGFVGGGFPVWSIYGTAGMSWAVPPCTCHPAERSPKWLQVLQKDVQQWSCKPPVLQRTKYLFYSHLCNFLGFTFLFSTFLLAPQLMIWFPKLSFPHCLFQPELLSFLFCLQGLSAGPILPIQCANPYHSCR